MGEKTGISWTDHTFNPWIGCAKVSAGCAHCYAERDNNRYAWVNGWGPQGERRRTNATNWKKPLAWNAAAMRDGVRRKVFCASLADVFEDRRDLISWRIDLFELIKATPGLDWLLLTKRIENVEIMLSTHTALWKNTDNIWIGTTAENQEMADQRIPELLKIPAKVRFVSVEPMIGPVYLVNRGLMAGLDWVICGGESGPGARPMDPEWARYLRDQCDATGVPFFFKQHGGTKRIDGHWGGDLLDGKQYHEFPA